MRPACWPRTGDGVVLTSRGRSVIAALLLVTACGGDGDTVASGASSTTASPRPTSTTATEDAADWCDEFASLERSEQDRLTSDDIDGAPEVIRSALDVLVELGDPDPAASSPGDLERGFRAVAEVETWSHQHCGGDHPFCSLWITVNGAMAAPAFVEEEQQDEAYAEFTSFLDDLDVVLIEVAPTEVRDDVETTLAWFSRVGDGAEMSDEDERVAEGAEAALDEWLWSEGCEGATEPYDE